MDDLVKLMLEDLGQFLNNNFEQEEKIIILVSLLFVIWETRNKNIFERSMSMSQAIRRFEDLTAGFLENNFKKKRGDIIEVLKDASWIALGAGWLMINVDAAIKDEKNAIAMVVRNNVGKILMIAAKLFQNFSLEMTKLMAIVWASSQM